ncbi:fungal hydrophobin [Pluteus cervinus]|uniref:Fungal hydrophobin n=1 Tax=Pluteus cervinus TaxID=181527 RepID=A0ACD3AED3_9AGAR|nr:fungal hydrophobin [Pluteus cervinus]
MQFKSLLFVSTIALSSYVSAASIVGRTEPQGQCNTGEIHCCDSTHTSSEAASLPLVGLLLGLLGINLSDIIGDIGFNCSPLSILGIAGNSCSAQPVCCTGNNFSGLIVVGCSPINLNL